jgi:hypothetical protein
MMSEDFIKRNADLYLVVIPFLAGRNNWKQIKASTELEIPGTGMRDLLAPGGPTIPYTRTLDAYHHHLDQLSFCRRRSSSRGASNGKHLRLRRRSRELDRKEKRLPLR